MNIPNNLGTAFSIEQLRWLLLNYVLVSETVFFKKKVSREIALDLISLFHVQIKEPAASRLTTTTAFVFLTKFAEFYYQKIFETRSR